MNTIIPLDYTKENTKIRVESNANCDEIIYLEKNCYNKEERLELENIVVNLVYNHHLECKKCQDIRKRRKERDLYNSIIKCESKAICGEIIHQEMPGWQTSPKEKSRLEQTIINMLHYHQQYCPDCQKEIKRRNQVYQRREKIKKLNDEK